MLSRLIYVVVYVSTVSLFLAEYYSIVWIYHPLLIHSSVDRHVVVSTFGYCTYCCCEHVCTSFCTNVFSCLGFPRSPACSTDLGRHITECRRIRYYESIKEGRVVLI